LYTTTNPYDVLDAQANNLGGALNANWDSAKVTHGIDH